ncbi:MAG: hypothetical protein V3S29_08815, partial [bacterium]
WPPPAKAFFSKENISKFFDPLVPTGPMAGAVPPGLESSCPSCPKNRKSGGLAALHLGQVAGNFWLRILWDSELAPPLLAHLIAPPEKNSDKRNHPLTKTRPRRKAKKKSHGGSGRKFRVED